MKYKFGICGPFDFNNKGTGGQSVKTREFYYSLCDAIGEENISILESTYYRRNFFLFFVKLIQMCHNCKNIIIFPAQNGIKFFAPICNTIKGNNKVCYCVIGGWLPRMAEKNRFLLKHLKNFDMILVETQSLKKALENLGLSNIKILNNFKRIKRTKRIKEHGDIIKICYFSRIVKMKGIEEAIHAVNELLANGEKCIFDIYGPISNEYYCEFERLVEKFPPQIRYKGEADPEKSVEIISKYDLQLFPTKYKTEGIPGAVIDSYFAGVPIVASKWNSFDDVIAQGVTGFGYEFNNYNDLVRTLKLLLNQPKLIDEMKFECLAKSYEYDSETVIQEFLEYIKEANEIEY